MVQTVKSLPATQETQVQSVGREDPLEKEMATHSSILGWRIPWMEEPGGLHTMGSQRVRHNWATSLSLSFTWSGYYRALNHFTSFPGGTSGKEPSCQCRRHKRRGFNPWVAKIPWRRAWQPTPVFFPGESHGQRSLVGYSSWSRTDSERTEVT